MQSLGDLLDGVEAQRKTLEVHSDDDAVVADLREQFSTRHVDVTRRDSPTRDSEGFVVVRGPRGEFLGALGVGRLAELASPEIHPPWELAQSEVNLAELLDFFDKTLFTAFERRQLLAVTREFEERAWRVGTGGLYAGFQRPAALAAQTSVYNRLADESSLDVRVFLRGRDSPALDDAVSVVRSEEPEIGRYWFVAFDGGQGGDMYKCALVAEERAGGYFGFWTDDPERVDELCSYLREEYDA
ncbi:DICT sensory domain-containing protein [Halobacterium sp. R2-5]|uniref:DICT sensory domain-containing protein n=1 Tax=Halobacterium sp. R2-5 TaxID=2715751 RepID=UPI001422D554|nr:DICT sensory domain-containing protein [Halobacterium sp. R2-5]NIB99433.1 histidine kinase [Halobacterium sp. R2-5]